MAVMRTLKESTRHSHQISGDRKDSLESEVVQGTGPLEQGASTVHKALVSSVHLWVHVQKQLLKESTFDQKWKITFLGRNTKVTAR